MVVSQVFTTIWENMFGTLSNHQASTSKENDVKQTFIKLPESKEKRQTDSKISMSKDQWMSNWLGGGSHWPVKYTII